jgi:hypothetical protein
MIIIRNPKPSFEAGTGDMVRLFSFVEQEREICEREPGIVIGERERKALVEVLWNDGSVTVCWRDELIPYGSKPQETIAKEKA